MMPSKVDLILRHRGHTRIIDSTTLKGYGRHVGLIHGVVVCIRARAVVQPCPHDRVKPAVQGAVKEDTQGVQEVPHK